MLWSMLKALIFVAATAVLAIGATYLLEIGDVALITVAGREFVLTPFVSVLLALAALVLVWILMRLTGLIVAGIRFLNGDETALTRYFNRRSEKRGFEALSDSILALAAGEGHLAIRKAERAAKLLARPEVTNLLIAQGAEMAGDKARATEAFKALVQDERTRFVGVRGLLQQKLAAGETDTALKLAEKALALRPKNADMQDTLLRLQAQYEDWAGARATLNAKLRSGTLPRDVHKRRDAVLALADAREALADGQIARATELAKSANRQSPSLVPAAVMAARMSIAEGKAKQAASVIQKAWGLAPHPDLAAAFAEIVPEETPEARIKRFRPLLKQHQGHREARLLEAELQIAAKEFDEARKALGSLAQDEPDARSLTVMAAIERGEGSEDRLVRAWLAKAVTASRGPQWLCEACGHVHAEWRPTCTHCDGFDTLHWAVPPQSEAALQGPEQMLPLIVGALDGPSPAAVETPETVATPQQTAPSEPMAEPVSGEDTLTLGPEFRIDDEEDASKGADAVQAARGVN